MEGVLDKFMENIWEKSMALIRGNYGRTLRYLYFMLAFRMAREDTPESYR